MNLIRTLLILAVCTLLFLDLRSKIDLCKSPWQVPVFFLTGLLPAFLLLQFITCIHKIRAVFPSGSAFRPFLLLTSVPGSLALAAALFLIWLYLLVRLHLMPFRKCDAGPCSRRIRLLYGGSRLIHGACLALFWQTLLFLLCFFPLREPVFRLLKAEGVSDGFSPYLFLLLSALLCYGAMWLLLLNGICRILSTSRNLVVLKRVLALLFLWFPVLNLYIMHFLCKTAALEYDYERYRFVKRSERAESDLCALRYPLILIHGIGFRDLRFFNYWGRIPAELERNGADIYYGHQEAWGTIENNAARLKEKIDEVRRITGCEKVNLIAHSKGGLDARYLISALHCGSQVASLTTVNTPHLGSELINVLNGLPDGLYRFLAGLFDKTFRKAGDENPDCYHASKQLAPSFCQEFNRTVKDDPRVCYRSYASVMTHASSDMLLSVPYLLMKTAAKGKPNDGLVAEPSAHWGHFCSTFRSTTRRGISHGDMIDLKREDYKGFDVIEAYVQLVAELKEAGF